MITLAAPGARPSPVPLILRAETSNAARDVRAGELVRVTRGVYAVAELWRKLAPWQRYLARVHAVARTIPEAVFILESGNALRGLPVFGEPPDVHAVLTAPAKSHTLTGVRIHSTERMPAFEMLDGIPVATPSELAVAIGRDRHPAVGLAVTNAILRQGPALTVATLAAVSAQRPTTRGVRALEWVLDRATPVPESALESVSLACVEWLGFPTPELQVWFRGPEMGDDDRVDFWWKQWGVAGEADGEVKYSSTAVSSVMRGSRCKTATRAMPG